MNYYARINLYIQQFLPDFVDDGKTFRVSSIGADDYEIEFWKSETIEEPSKEVLDAIEENKVRKFMAAKRAAFKKDFDDIEDFEQLKNLDEKVKSVFVNGVLTVKKNKTWVPVKKCDTIAVRNVGTTNFNIDAFDLIGGVFVGSAIEKVVWKLPKVNDILEKISDVKENASFRATFNNLGTSSVSIEVDGSEKMTFVDGKTKFDFDTVSTVLIFLVQSDLKSILILFG